MRKNYINGKCLACEIVAFINSNPFAQVKINAKMLCKEKKKLKCTLCQGHYDFFLFRFLLYICLLCRGIKVMPLIDCFHLLL